MTTGEKYSTRCSKSSETSGSATPKEPLSSIDEGAENKDEPHEEKEAGRGRKLKQSTCK